MCFVLLSLALAACGEPAESQAEQDSSAEQSALSESKEESAEESSLPETTEESEPETSVDPSEELVHVAPDFAWDSVEEWDGQISPMTMDEKDYFDEFLYRRHCLWLEEPDRLTWVTIRIPEKELYHQYPDDAETIDERSAFAKRFLADAGRPFVSQTYEREQPFIDGTVLTWHFWEICTPLTYNEIKMLTAHGGYSFAASYSPRNEKSEWYGTIN